MCIIISLRGASLLTSWEWISLRGVPVNIMGMMFGVSVGWECVPSCRSWLHCLCFCAYLPSSFAHKFSFNKLTTNPCHFATKSIHLQTTSIQRTRKSNALDSGKKTLSIHLLIKKTRVRTRESHLSIIQDVEEARILPNAAASHDAVRNQRIQIRLQDVPR